MNDGMDDEPWARIQNGDRLLLFRLRTFGRMLRIEEMPRIAAKKSLWTTRRRSRSRHRLFIFLVSVPCSPTKSCHFPLEQQRRLFHFSYNLVKLERILDKEIDHSFSIENSVAFEH
jgi:hypothetical protein